MAEAGSFLNGLCSTGTFLVPGEWDAYSAGMHGIWLLLLCAVVLALFGFVYLAFLSWPKMTPKKRIASLLLLAPDFLFVACIPCQRRAVIHLRDRVVSIHSFYVAF